MKAIVVILILLIALGADAITGFSAIVAQTSLPTNICNPSNQLCDQIMFDQVVFGNFTNPLGMSVLTSNSWTATLNETLVLVADSNIGGVITNIKDTALDTFTRQVFLSQNCLPCQNFEIWTAKTKAATGTVSTVTVTWNATTNNVFIMASYLNVAGIGNSTGIQANGASGSFTIMPAFSGSKIVGGTGLSPASNVPCTTLVAGTFLTQRRDACSKTVIPEVEADLEDNMTVLRNTQAFTYSSSWPGQGSSISFQMGAVELIGFDKEPSFPNFNNFCTTTNGLCVTTQYSINAVKETTGTNALNKALPLNTAFCTGITTSAITIGTHPLFGWAEYGGVSLNVTSAKLQVQFYISTNVPSTVFGSGLCATGGTLLAVGYIFFPISGSLSATNAFTVAINGNCGSSNAINCVAGTYYGWLEITAMNFASGSLGFDQVTNQVYSSSGVNLMEIK